MSPLVYVIAAAVLVTAGGGFLYVAIRARRARAALVEATERLGASAQRLHEDANRLPSPEELEDLSRRLYEGSIPDFDVAFAPVKTESWENTFETVRASCRIFAKTAWKLGAR